DGSATRVARIGVTGDFLQQAKDGQQLGLRLVQLLDPDRGPCTLADCALRAFFGLDRTLDVVLDFSNGLDQLADVQVDRIGTDLDPERIHVSELVPSELGQLLLDREAASARSDAPQRRDLRSEERRVGKGGSRRWGWEH